MVATVYITEGMFMKRAIKRFHKGKTNYCPDYLEVNISTITMRLFDKLIDWWERKNKSN